MVISYIYSICWHMKLVFYVRQQRLGRSPNETFWVEVLGELVAKFRKQEEWCLWLERPQMRVCDLHLGPPFDRA
jgi:hypothetical protein